MEFIYKVINRGDIPTDYCPETYFITRNNIIIDATKNILDVAIGKSADIFLRQAYVWGKLFDVEIQLIGLTDVVDLVNIVEEQLKDYVSKDVAYNIRVSNYVPLKLRDDLGLLKPKTEKKKERFELLI